MKRKQRQRERLKELDNKKEGEERESKIKRERGG